MVSRCDIGFKKVRVALIDSGISSAILFKNITIIRHDLFHLDSNSIHIHGTEIAQIYDQCECKIIEIHDIPILDQELTCKLSTLKAALDYCYHLDIDAINLSLGFQGYFQALKLRKTIKKLVKKGISIVAASSNAGYKTYPACLKGVYNVVSDYTLNETEVYSQGKFIYACGNYVNHNLERKRGTSYSVPRVIMYMDF